MSEQKHFEQSYKRLEKQIKKETLKTMRRVKIICSVVKADSTSII